MPTKVSCPSCSRQLLVPDELQGKSVRCPSCETVFTAQTESTEHAPAPPPRPASDDFERVRREPASPPLDRDEERPLRRDRWEDDEDAYHDTPRYGRRIRNGGHQFALDAVSGPATALQVVGWIGVALSSLSLCLNLVGAMAQMPAGPNKQPNQVEAVANGVSGIIGAVVGIVFAVIILIGAGKMKRLENYGFAMASSIIAMLPCTACCILGLPFGIWSLVVLNKPEVKDSFR
jgi:predicted Zn finger-like uncharacterized protein